MFCGNCGTHNNESSAFCANCGAPLTLETPAPQAPAPKRSKKGLIIGLSIGAAVLAILAVVLILTLGGGKKSGAQAPEDIAAQYMDCFLDADIRAMLDIIPEEVIDETFDALNTPESWADRMSARLEEMFDEMDAEYDRWDISYKIDDVSNLDADDLEDLQEFYDNRYNCQVDACKEVTVDVTIQLDGYEEDEELTVFIIQVDGKWYVEMEESDNLFSLITEILYY